MAKTKLELEVSAQDSASKVLNRFNENLQNLDTAARKMTKVFGELGRTGVKKELVSAFTSAETQTNKFSKVVGQLTTDLNSLGKKANPTATDFQKLSDSLRETQKRKTALKRSITILNKVYDEHREELEENKVATERADHHLKLLAQQLKRADQQYSTLKKKVKEATEAKKKQAEETKKATEAEKKNEKQLKKSNSALKTYALNFGKYLLVYKAGGAVIDSFRSALRETATNTLDFEQALAKSSTIAGGFSGNMTKAENSIKNLSSKFGVDAVEATESFYNTLSAGFKENPLEIMAASQKAAIAGNIDMKTSTEAITAAMNIFGEETKNLTEVNDVFFNMVDQGRLTMDQIPDALGKTGETASNMGVSFKELGGILAASTKTTNSLNKSSTQVRSALTAMLKPSKDMERVFQSLGVKTGKQLIEKMGGALGAFQAVRTASGELELSLGDVLGRKEALNAVLSLTDENLSRTASVIESVGNNSGTTEAAVAKMTKTMGHKMKVAKQNALRLGRAFMGPLMKGLNSFFTSFGNGFSKSIGKLIDFELALTTLSRVFVMFGKLIQTIFVTIGKTIGTSVAGILGALRKAFSGDFKGAFEEIKKAGKVVVKDFNDEMLELGSSIDTMLSSRKFTLSVDSPASTKNFKEAGEKVADEISGNIDVDPSKITVGKKKGKIKTKNLDGLFNSLGNAMAGFGRRATGKRIDILNQLIPDLQGPARQEFEAKMKEVGQLYQDQFQKLTSAIAGGREGEARGILDHFKLQIMAAGKDVDKIGAGFLNQQNEMLNRAGAIGSAFSNVAGALGGVISEVERFNSSLAKGLGFIQRFLTIISQIKMIEQSITTLKQQQALAEKGSALAKISATGGIIAGGLGILGTALGFFHNGGPIQRLHNGGVPNRLSAGEVPIIAQTGEYMLSRKAVQNMGGTKAVDNMHRNAQAGGTGGGTNVHLNLAFDPDNFRSFITGTAEGRDIVKQAIIGAFPT